MATGVTLKGPNDVTIDGKGGSISPIWPAPLSIALMHPARSARILAAPDIQRPNGIQVSPDDKTLYLVEANQAAGGARMIRAFELQPDGTVRNMRVHYNFYPGRSADGMSIDTQGNLYASAGLHRRRGTSETLDTPCGVHVISPQGKRIKFIPIPEDTITNNAFGGPDMKTLYVTAGKTLCTRLRTEIAGLPSVRHDACCPAGVAAAYSVNSGSICIYLGFQNNRITTMPNWDADLYLKFAGERTQPAVDLISRISLAHPEPNHRSGLRSWQQHRNASGSVGPPLKSSAWTARGR